MTTVIRYPHPHSLITRPRRGLGYGGYGVHDASDNFTKIPEAQGHLRDYRGLRPLLLAMCKHTARTLVLFYCVFCMRDFPLRVVYTLLIYSGCIVITKSYIITTESNLNALRRYNVHMVTNSVQRRPYRRYRH